ncbi:unnamed protein product [Rotaria sordida]|uniref:Ubiquitin carboxyl-terminal hydrolase n=2 Tax=Rotaria sordida TaxID=392033 RepID=A0A813X7F4_9BILA|nr:unnamed protein product [Rotaria sordida]
MSSVINVLFSTMKGSKHTAQLKEGYTVEDIKKIVQEKFGSTNYRLIVNGQEIQDNDLVKFTELKKSIKNNTIIYVCQRMDGGSGLVDIDSHKATVLVDLQDELRKIPTQQTNSECMICTEEKKCMKYCCSSIICKECFPNHFIFGNYKIICLTCNQTVSPEKVFVTPQFIQSLVQLDETKLMARNIDFQICTCGAFSINSTMYAKQKCNNCQRWLCFFCNTDWNENERNMRNEKYTCRVNCFWETKITYQLVTLNFNKAMKVPNRRCCPKCFECGCVEENSQTVVSRSTSDSIKATEDDLNSQTNSSPFQFKRSHLNTTPHLPLKPKLPPIQSISSSSSSDHQRVSTDHSSLLPTRHTPGVCGLKNIGNTCYMNSAIQCLNSIPDLTKWIMQQQLSLSHMNIIDVYISLVQSMWSGHHGCVTPRELKQYVSRSSSIFSDSDQKDSHEFLNSLLNAIETVDSNSFLINLFRIHTQSMATCNKCQHCDIINETITFLPLSIPEFKFDDQKKILLEDLIKDFCQEDELDGQYYCHKCKICQSARHKTIIIQPLPRVLIIQLKRFPYDGTKRKIDTFVQYKLEHRNLLSNNDRYELYAISMHSGNLAGGHYTTMAQNYIINKWYRFDDSYFEEIESKKVLVPFIARQAYILIYLKKND